MTYDESVEYLLSLGNEVSAMKLGLDNIRTLLAALGDPQTKYLKVQVAGTNGKGSVCAFLDAICQDAGISAGLFTSPHLVRINERVRIDGNDISDEEFAATATRVRETAEGLVTSGALRFLPTFFEQITAIALAAFADAGVELGILETGLGGRLDATTAANAEIVAISRIDLDHQEYLGETIEEIAAEKAAIIHEGSRVFVGSQSAAAANVILEKCREAGVEAVPAQDLAGRFIPEIGLAGAHQVENAAIAVRIAEALRSNFNITDANIAAGLKNARHPGRMETKGRYLLDGAHNAGGARALAAYLDEQEIGSVTLVFAAMRDKDVREILAALAPRASRIVLTQASNERSIHYDELLAALPPGVERTRVFVTDHIRNALAVAEAVSSPDGTVLITGSLYLVGEAGQIIDNLR